MSVALTQSKVESAMLDELSTTEPTPRVARMREAFFDIEPTVSIVRARIEARVMKATAGEPMVTRRAKVFAAVAREMPVEIYADELLVGCASDAPRCFNIIPGAEHTPATAARLSDEDARELAEELSPYWREQGRVGRVAHWHYGHNVHGMTKVLDRGFLGIKKEAEERLARLDLTDPLDVGKIPFLEGVVQAMQAAAETGQRYAARARELAGKEQNTERKTELLRVAEVCDRVPARPARTFHEALQSYHFAWMLLIRELSYGEGFSQGRMDQYLHPYYESDIREGRITREQAQELLDCYIIKLNHVGDTGSIGVGGVKTDGNDATNDLSFMFMDAMAHTRMVSPYFALHVHSKTPDDLLQKACDLCSKGDGHPQFLNSDVMVAQALARGSTGGPPITLADARSASNVGCLELVIPGKDSGYLYIGGHNLASALELALTNGVRRCDQKKIGVETGDPRQFRSFEEIREAFRQQVAWMRKNTQISGAIFEQSLIDLYPTVYESALIEDCIEKGLCREDGGAHYNFNTGGVEHGSTDAGDSLAAINKLVFEDKRITMDQLCDALEANFDGCDDIHRMCSQAPKFGNDDDAVDEQVAWVVHVWATEFKKIKNLRGGSGCPGGSPMSAYVPEGLMVGALPSGRLAGEPLAPAACPGTGKDLKGPTAVLKSMGKVDNVEVLGGLSLTSRIDPAVFETRDGVRRLADMVRTFVDQKIFHWQLNVVSSETLRDAQNKPEEHRDLMVKVSGYNAYFTQLTKPLQDSIIARTEHGM